MLQFTMGTVGLENPMDKRYFYALNSDGKMVAFIVFVPFLGKNGYMADVTRHGKDAPGGVMETVPSTGSSENFKPFQYPNIKKSCCFTNLICKTTAFLFLFIYLLSIYGHRGDRIRTCDLLIPNQAL